MKYILIFQPKVSTAYSVREIMHSLTEYGKHLMLQILELGTSIGSCSFGTPLSFFSLGGKEVPALQPLNFLGAFARLASRPSHLV